MKSSFWLLICFVVAIGGAKAGRAQEPPQTERVLIPVLWHGAGFGGSVWQSELFISNSGAASVVVAPGSPVCQFELCDKTLEPGTMKQVEGTGTGAIQGVYYVVEKAYASDIHFQLRVWDSSRETENFGASIPVVRKSEWLSSTTEFLHVPIDGVFRVTLRAYEYQPSDTLSVLVSILPEDGDDVLAQTTLPLLGGDILSTEYPLVPSYAMITNLLEQFPTIEGQEYVRIRVAPVAPSPREYWAFVSVTNNLTQTVTILTPE